MGGNVTLEQSQFRCFRPASSATTTRLTRASSSALEFARRSYSIHCQAQINGLISLTKALAYQPHNGEQNHRSQLAIAGEFSAQISSVDTAIAGGWVQTFGRNQDYEDNNPSSVLLRRIDPFTRSGRASHSRRAQRRSPKDSCPHDYS